MSIAKKKFEGFSEFEREAMKNRAKELLAESKSSKNRALGEKAVQEAIRAMLEPDKSMASRVHELIMASAPTLAPKTWYGMPAYADNEGKVVCFFQAAGKFKARYATLGFSDVAKLDEGKMWPSSFAITQLTKVEEKQIKELVRRAIETN